MEKKIATSVSLLALACFMPVAVAAARSEPASVSIAKVAPAAPEKFGYDQFTLPNGLTVLVHTNRARPSVYVGMWYKTGSRDEGPGRSGFAHLFEHLMFQPTANRKGEYFDRLTQVGATDVNGNTERDWTAYHEVVPKDALDLALWLESDRMTYLPGGITQDVLDEQRRVVKNEKRQNELQPGDLILDRYAQQFYAAGHPYAHSIIGTMEDLDKASLDDVKQWFRDKYGASNAVLVLSGDVSLEEAKAKVGHYFADASAGRPISRITQWVPTFDAVKRDRIYANVGNVSIARSWGLSNDDPRANTLLQLVAVTLAGARNSWLHKRLVEEQKVAIAVGARVTDHMVSSSFDINLVLSPGITPAEGSRALDEALAAYGRRGPALAQIRDIVTASNAMLGKLGDSNAQAATTLAEGYIAHQDPLYIFRQRDWAAGATPDALAKLSRTLWERPYFESELLPFPAAQEPEKVDRTTIPMPELKQQDISFPKITETTLSNGMKLVVGERHDQPVVSASMQFATGSSAEGGYAPGSARQAFRLMTLGTQVRDGQALAAEMGRIGMGAGGSAGRTRSGFTWSAKSDQQDAAFALAAEILRRPAYPAAELASLTAQIDREYDALDRNPMQAGQPVFARALWGKDHPLGKITGREEAKRFSRDDVVRFHDREIGPNIATLYIVGDIDIDHAKALAERNFGDWQPAGKAVADSVTPPKAAGPRVILVDAPGAQQSSIIAGELIQPFNSETAAAQSLMDNILGGSFASRLNMNLREDKGWAYGFNSSVTNVAAGPRVFSASGTVQVDKTADSMVEIRKEISDFITTRPPTQAELDRERTAALQTIPASFNNNAAFLGSIISSASYGLPYDRGQGSLKRLADVTLDDVRTLAGATYKPDQLTWVVVGDLRKIESQIRTLNFAPVEVWDRNGNRLR